MTRARIAATALALASCYHPEPPSGAPCSTSGECPGDEQCHAGVCGGSDRTGSDAGADAHDPMQVQARVGWLVIHDTTTETVTDPTRVSVVLDDGTSPVLAFDADGGFSFARASATQGYTILTGILTPTGLLEVQSTAPALSYLRPTYGRVDPPLPTMATRLVFDLGSSAPLARGATIVFASGQRSSVTSLDDPNMFTVDWKTGIQLGEAGAALVDSMRGDALWVFHVSLALDGHELIDAVAQGSEIQQADGSTTQVSSNYRALSPTGCTRISGAISSETARMTALGSGSTPTSLVAVASTPVRDASVLGALLIAGASGASDPINVSYAAPFATEQLLATTQITRSETHASGTATLSTATTLKAFALFDNADVDCGTLVTFGLGAPIPTTAVVAGSALVQDNQIVMLPDASPTIAVAIETGDVAADIYRVILVDLSTGAQTTYLSASATVHIERARFVAGHEYIFTVKVEVGYPRAQAGDLDTLAYPQHSALRSTTTFQVQ